MSKWTKEDTLTCDKSLIHGQKYRVITEDGAEVVAEFQSCEFEYWWLHNGKSISVAFYKHHV